MQEYRTEVFLRYFKVNIKTFLHLSQDRVIINKIKYFIDPEAKNKETHRK